MKREVYDKQLKLAAVKLAGSLRRWINEYDEYGESAFPGHGNALFNSTYKITKLQKENEALCQRASIMANNLLCRTAIDAPPLVMLGGRLCCAPLLYDTIMLQEYGYDMDNRDK